MFICLQPRPVRVITDLPLCVLDLRYVVTVLDYDIFMTLKKNNLTFQVIASSQTAPLPINYKSGAVLPVYMKTGNYA